MLEVAAEPRPPVIEKAGNGWTALHRAAAGKDAEVGQLIEAGAAVAEGEIEGGSRWTRRLAGCACCSAQATFRLTNTSLPQVRES